MSSMPGENLLMETDTWISGVANCTHSEVFLDYVNCHDETDLVITASSTYGNIDQYGPQNALDGKLVETDGEGLIESTPFFLSGATDPRPWIQIDYGCSVGISLVMITHHFNPAYSTDQQVVIKVHVGDAPALVEQMSSNEVCATFTGLVIVTRFEVLECHQIMYGRYVQI